MTPRADPATTQSVHPHGRGDNDNWTAQWDPYDGSPPRAWGQSRIGHLTRLRTRFTPTGVGTMKTACLSTHPGGICRNASNGSPPRAWGQYGGYPQCGDRNRFTPTGVGTIGKPPDGCIRRTVHPHGRGDNGVAPSRPTNGAGSPPRAWGQCLDDARLGQDKRFTPTGVGTMARTIPRITRMTVHPHGRGDNLSEVRSASWAVGSPPRAWGQ